MPVVHAFSPIAVAEFVAVWEDSFAYWCKEIFPDMWWYSRTSNPWLMSRQTRLSEMILHWNVRHCDPRLSVHQSCIEHQRSSRAFDHGDFQVRVVSASELAASFVRVPRKGQMDAVRNQSSTIYLDSIEGQRGFISVWLNRFVESAIRWANFGFCIGIRTIRHSIEPRFE